MELAGTITLFLVIYLSCLVIISAKKKIARKGTLPPGPTPLPLIGNFLQIKSGKILQSLLKLREKYGPVFTVYFGTRPIVVLCGHDAVKEALIDKAEEFSGRKTNPTLERTFQGHEKPFDPTYYLSRAVSNVICSIVFGDRFDYKDKEFQSLMEMMNNSFREMSTARAQLYDMYVEVLKYFPGPETKIYNFLDDMRVFIAKRVKENQKTLDPNSPRDFIDCFLIQMEKEKDNPSSEFNIKNLELTALTLFFAGTETVSSTLRYGFLLLMKYPDVQAKMHEEIDRVIGQNRVPNIEDRSQMPYVDAVIHEVQRVSDLIPMDVPHSVIRDTEFRGYVIPKGTEIYPMLTTVLHDPTKFDTPDAFNPGHFLDEDGRFKKNDAFVPFSSGKRICLGEALARMELFLFFTTILQRFWLKPLQAPQDIDTTPQESGFANIPPLYQLSIIPR
ncbi:cytochrome P450 2G1-like isoform X2 [Elgaria multicarinata webbii]|uniref:cytochrome P450 2G1-like isoform X2 n=1 Tax=Elgaria multicarinata webbii TaxID=159646 RepID=UPI002FCCC25A